MKTIQIFEPAMCCSTGLCGVSVDPELLRVSAVLDVLKQHGVAADRFNLSSAPMEFVSHAVIGAFLAAHGPEGLPAVLLDGELVLSGRYPTNDEFAAWLGLPSGLLHEAVQEQEQPQGCCCEGGCC